MKNTKLAAAKLRMAMSGLKAAYQDASAEDRKVIVATMKEVQAVHGQLVNAEDEAVEDEEDVEGMESEDLDEGDGESADDLEMDEMAEEDAAAGMNMDDAHMSEDDMVDMDEMEAAPEAMPPLAMDDMSMDGMGDEGAVADVDGLDIPQEFIGDLGDLGLIEMGESDEMVEDDGEEMSAEDEELAVAALALAANALKMLKAESEEDEPESSQEEDRAKEKAEHKAMKRGEELHAHMVRRLSAEYDSYARKELFPNTWGSKSTWNMVLPKSISHVFFDDGYKPSEESLDKFIKDWNVQDFQEEKVREAIKADPRFKKATSASYRTQPKVAAKTGDDDVVRKLREISARLSTVKTPAAKPAAKAPVAASAQKRGMREVLGNPLAQRARSRAR